MPARMTSPVPCLVRFCTPPWLLITPVIFKMLVVISLIVVLLSSDMLPDQVTVVPAVPELMKTHRY